MGGGTFHPQISYLLVVVTLLPGLIMGNLFGSDDNEYSVVIDAGSSSTKLLVTVFEKKSGKLRLDTHETFETFRPGLADFIGDSQEVSKIKDQIENILKEAEHAIPDSKLADTPVTFRATAGFRLLSEENRNFLLQEVKEVLTSSKFKKTQNCASILSESDEGLFGWVAANLLLDRLHGSPTDMVATLDLGGSSTQITFPLTQGSFQQFPLQVRWVPVAGEIINFYTHSFLGLGLGAATVAVLSTGKTDHGNLYDTPCTSFRDNGKTYHYNGQSYTVYRTSVRPEDSDVDIERCTTLVQDFVNSFNIRKYEPLHNYEIHAFAGFFYVLSEAGLIDAKTGGRVALSEIKDTANKVCNLKEPQEDPFLCLHIIYIYSLLTEGYKLQDSEEILVDGEVNNHQVHWALGFALYNRNMRQCNAPFVNNHHINWALGFAHYTRNMRQCNAPFVSMRSQTNSCDRVLTYIPNNLKLHQ